MLPKFPLPFYNDFSPARPAPSGLRTLLLALLSEKGVMFYDDARTIAERMVANIPQGRTGKN